jgi:uncharacterized protein (TIGR02391 family)
LTVSLPSLTACLDDGERVEIPDPVRRRARGSWSAVLDTSLALQDYVKQKSRCRDKDGADLMGFVFLRNGPVLSFNALADDDADKSEQEGLLELFEVVTRNPRAHALPDDSPEMALECIALSSLLAQRLDQAKPVRP